MRSLLFGLLAFLMVGLSLGTNTFAADGFNTKPWNKKETTKQALQKQHDKRIHGRIVGGEDSSQGQWPWMVALLRPGFGSPSNRQFCGGSLIAPQWVLTAAHCTIGASPADIVVGLNLHNLKEDTGDELIVSDILIHPDFSSSTLDFDVSLLHLSQPAPEPFTVMPLVDHLDLVATGTSATVIGWGALGEGNTDYPGILQQVEVPMIECAPSYEAVGQTVTENMICAGIPAGGIDSCQGDSGGPIMVLDDDAWKQIGIVSWGIGCARPDLPGVYTHVYNMLGWMDQQFERFEPTTLKKGWNLIASQEELSLPIEEFFAARNFSTEDQSFDSVWAWNPETNNWQIYLPSESTENFNSRNNSSLETLQKIAPGKGYWINIKQELFFSYQEPPVELPEDDHANSFEEATPLALGVETSGEIAHAGDYDFFSFVITEAGEYSIQTLGNLDSYGTLLDAQSTILEENDDWNGYNFFISKNLEPGTYYVVVHHYSPTGTGSYDILVEQYETPLDDHADSIGQATPIAFSSSVAGTIGHAGDLDFFSFTLTESTSMQLYSTGSVDVVGALLDDTGAVLSSNDDGGAGYNFSIIQSLSAGTYYVQVSPYSSGTGDYTLFLSSPETVVETPNKTTKAPKKEKNQ